MQVLGFGCRLGVIASPVSRKPRPLGMCLCLVERSLFGGLVSRETTHFGVLPFGNVSMRCKPLISSFDRRGLANKAEGQQALREASKLSTSASAWSTAKFVRIF